MHYCTAMTSRFLGVRFWQLSTANLAPRYRCQHNYLHSLVIPSPVPTVLPRSPSHVHLSVIMHLLGHTHAIPCVLNLTAAGEQGQLLHSTCSGVAAHVNGAGAAAHVDEEGSRNCEWKNYVALSLAQTLMISATIVPYTHMHTQLSCPFCTQHHTCVTPSSPHINLHRHTNVPDPERSYNQNHQTQYQQHHGVYNE